MSARRWTPPEPQPRHPPCRQSRCDPDSWIARLPPDTAPPLPLMLKLLTVHTLGQGRIRQQHNLSAPLRAQPRVRRALDRVVEQRAPCDTEDQQGAGLEDV